MKKYPSIFDDALAPVTPGPSSSNTCGPSRITRVARQIFGSKPEKLIVELSTKGNLVVSYYGMRTDMAFLNGALGRSCTHPRFTLAFADAAREGIILESHFRDDLPGYPTHLAMITLRSADGTAMTFSSVSVGGGAFLIDGIDGCPVSIEGDCHELLVFTDELDPEQAGAMLCRAKALPGFNDASWHRGPKGGILQVKTDRAVEENAAQTLCKLPGGRFWRKVSPELEVVSSATRTPPFETSQQFVDYVNQNNISLWQAAVDYELAISGWTQEEILARIADRWDVIEESIQGGFREDKDMQGIVPAHAPQVRQAFQSGKLIPLGAIDYGAPVSLAIMEHSNCSGIITCIPTGGSSGVVPGALYGAAHSLGKSKEELLQALLVAGLMGTFMEPTKYLGALGCQAEIGCAAGMAAAGLITLMEGTAEQACSAAVMSIQSLTGLLCDKIGGLVQVPCLSRNMTAVSIATTCANAVMAGMEPLIPLEETIAAMLRSGGAIRDGGINRMGASCTPTACRLSTEYRSRKQ